MENKTYYALPALGVLFVFIFSACSTFGPQNMVDVYRDTTDSLPTLLMLDSLTLDQQVEDRVLAKKLPEVIALVAYKYDFQIATKAENNDKTSEAAYGLVDVWLKEQKYIRSLDTCYSITAIVTITHPTSHKVMARALYSEESTLSLQSFQYLYKVLEEVFKALKQKVD